VTPQTFSVCSVTPLTPGRVYLHHRVGGPAPGADLHRVAPGHRHPPRRRRGRADAPAAGHVERVHHRALRLQFGQRVHSRGREDVGWQVGRGQRVDPAADEPGVEPPGAHVGVGD
jgi:hypothetical protein